MLQAGSAPEELVDKLRAIGFETVDSAELVGATGPLRLERALHTSVPVGELMAVAGSPVAIHAASSVIREYLRSRRTKLRLSAPDGSSLEVDGNLSLEELEKILSAASFDRKS